MKKLSLMLFAMALFIAAANAQTEQTRQVSGFNSVANSGSFSVHIKMDGTEGLKISGDEKIINDIETVVKDGTLKIGFKNNFSWHRNVGKVDVYVSAKALSGLSNSGSGTIKLEGELTGADVALHNSGSGTITTSAKAGKIMAHNSGSGSIYVNGTADDETIGDSGSGGVNAEALKANNANVRVSGSGNVRIYAEKTISAHVSGSGNVSYGGNATLTDSKTSGSGRIRKADRSA